jgi:hypothetical protein
MPAGENARLRPLAGYSAELEKTRGGLPGSRCRQICLGIRQWWRKITRILAKQLRLIPSPYVKPFGGGRKRGIDAEAICELLARLLAISR